jgi:hypothetical protein
VGSVRFFSRAQLRKSFLFLPIAPGSRFVRAIGFRLVENVWKRPVNIISLGLVWLDRDVELDLRPGSRWALPKSGCQGKTSPDINTPDTNGQLR